VVHDRAAPPPRRRIHTSIEPVVSMVFRIQQSFRIAAAVRVKSEILCECQTGEHGLLVGQAVAA